MISGKPAAFRPPNEQFCEAFNLAMDATGADISTLAIEAINEGLQSAVAKLIDRRRQAEARYSQVFGPRGRSGGKAGR